MKCQFSEYCVLQMAYFQCKLAYLNMSGSDSESIRYGLNVNISKTPINELLGSFYFFIVFH